MDKLRKQNQALARQAMYEVALSPGLWVLVGTGYLAYLLLRFPLLGFGILMALVVFGLLLLAGNRDLKRKQKDPQWALYDEVRRLREEVERLRHEH